MDKRLIYNVGISACAVLFFTFIIIWGYSQLDVQEKSMNINLYTLVPEECDAIIEIEQIEKMMNSPIMTTDVHTFQQLQAPPLLQLFINQLNDFSKEQAHGLKHDLRNLLVSFHSPGGLHDLIIYGSLSSDSPNIIEKLFSEDFTVFTQRRISYHEEEIVIYPIDKEFIACYFKPGFFAISRQIRLIEQVIDAHKEGKTVVNDQSFTRLKENHKAGNHPFTVYLQQKQQSTSSVSPLEMPVARWQKYNIRFNNESIFFSGECSDAEGNTSLAQTIQQEKTDSCMQLQELPVNIEYFYQIPCNNQTMFVEQHDSMTIKGNKIVKDLLQLYTSRHAKVIHYYIKEETDKPMKIISAPLADNLTEIEDFLRETRFAKRLPSIWTSKGRHLVWEIGFSNILAHHLKENTGSGYVITFDKNSLLIATDTEALREYIIQTAEMPKEKEENTLACNRNDYLECMNDLAEVAHFTFAGDLDGILNTQHGEEKEIPAFLPAFIFKHPDFFRNFIFSFQLTCTNEKTMNTNMIFHFKSNKENQ